MLSQISGKREIFSFLPMYDHLNTYFLQVILDSFDEAKSNEKII